MRRAFTRLLVSVGCSTVGLTLAAYAAEIVKPDIKPGLWEVTSTPQMTGEMPIPEEQLAKLSPEQRARFEAAMKATMAKPHVYRECMTPEKIARGFDIDKDGEDSTCKRKVISSSSTQLQLHDECDKPEHKTVSDVQFQLKGGVQMTGKINVVVTSGSKTMTINNALQGKWLGSDCGSVKEFEVQK